jgi:hypothetical protein
VTVTSDPLPTQLKGIPLQLKAINVTIDRPEFEFNPTSCEPMAVTGSLQGSEGASFPVSSRFQVSGCQSLPFHPTLTASTAGQASKNGGASLDVKVTSQGLGVANIAKVDLELPISLPSRLTTLQKSCPDHTFQATPIPGQACNEESVIGSGVVHTPVLKSALTGPAYLVSHGGRAFPDVEFVLQGERILVVLDGETEIAPENGIERTYSRFNNNPDVPFTSFEANLPMGPHSALAANVPWKAKYSLCQAKLTMPTQITGQNGTVIQTTTNIKPEGCHPPPKKPTPPTRAQQLQKALTACRHAHPHNKHARQTCETQAHKHYPTKTSRRGGSRTARRVPRSRP